MEQNMRVSGKTTRLTAKANSIMWKAMCMKEIGWKTRYFLIKAKQR
jgi:hypothetical protein